MGTIVSIGSLLTAISVFARIVEKMLEELVCHVPPSPGEKAGNLPLSFQEKIE